MPGVPVPVPTALMFRGGRLLQRRPRWSAHEFAEGDYRWGKGTLRLRLVHVEWSRVVVCQDDKWLETEGVVIDSAGREGDRRQYLIRAESIPAPVARERPRFRVERRITRTSA
jgi:hypothetical protein